MQNTDDHWPRRVALATDWDGLGKIAFLVGDGFFDGEDAVFDRALGEVRIELWRATGDVHCRRWIWPIDTCVFAQANCILRIRNVEDAQIRIDAMPTDMICDVQYAPESSTVVLKLMASASIVLRVRDIWAEVEDLAPPVFDGPFAQHGGLRLRW